MISDINGESESPLNDERLPSLLALRCFEAAARLENFSRAAAELYLTHGAVSRAVRLLEDELGVALFERRSRRVFLTDAGRTLARAVCEGMDLMRQAVSELRARASQKRQWVLSCEPTLLMRWLIPAGQIFRLAIRAPMFILLPAAARSLLLTASIWRSAAAIFRYRGAITPNRCLLKKSARFAVPIGPQAGLAKNSTLPHSGVMHRVCIRVPGPAHGRNGQPLRGIRLLIPAGKRSITSISACRPPWQASAWPSARGTWCVTMWRAAC